MSYSRTLKSFALSTTFVAVIGSTGTVENAHAQSSHYHSTAPSVTSIDGSEEPVGGFGRMFPLYTGDITDKNHYIDSDGVVHYLLEHPSHRIELLRLADEMITPDDVSKAGSMPLAHVFLGQFIDHDITLDTTSNFDSLAGNVPNARTPDLDLDCIYGNGREASPFLYSGPYLRVGAMTVDAQNPLYNRFDLLRIPEPQSGTFSLDQDAEDDHGITTKVDTVAVIGDPRNDENFAVAQVQAAFIAYHNRMVNRLIERALKADMDKSQALISSLEEVKEIIDEGLVNGETFVAVMDNIRGLSGFKIRSISPFSRDNSDFVNNQVQRSISIQSYAASKEQSFLNKETDNAEQPDNTALTEVLAIVNYAIDQNKRELADLRATQLSDPHFVETVFEEARDLTIHHYHRVIMEDFLPRVISGKRVLDMMSKGRNFYFPGGFRPGEDQPYIPIEFSVAAYRFAHSQVPGRFKIRDDQSSALFRGARNNEPGDLLPNGFTPIRTRLNTQGGEGPTPQSLVIDWSFLIDVNKDQTPEKARKIDTLLSTPLENLDIPGVTPAGGLSNLAARNLSRGRTYRLPSGQDLARVIMDVLAKQDSLGAYEIDAGTDKKNTLILSPDSATSAALISDETPLWYYIIQEASCFELVNDDIVPMRTKLYSGKADQSEPDCNVGGDVLGPVGGTIVGEVLWGLVDHYRVNTGSGIDLNVHMDYCLVHGDEDEACPLNERNPAQTIKGLSETRDDDGGRRYLFKNFLYDAGVAYSLADAQAVTVCSGPAHLPDAACTE